MNESQLIDDLRTALDEASSGIGASPGMAVRARASARRRRATRAVLAGVPVLALAAGAVVTLHGAAPAGSVSPSASAGGQPKVVTAAYVRKQVEAALADASDYMIKETSSTPYDGNVTTWIDPRTAAIYSTPGEGPGQSAQWSGTYWSGGYQNWRGTFVDYSQRTWSTSVERAGAPSAPSIGDIVPGGSPAQLSQLLETGAFKITGYGDVNGHHAMALSADVGLYTEVTWVDTQTYQPVRLVKVFHTAHPADLTVNEFWSPRTPSLVKLVNDPAIPAGYTQVAAPPQS